MRSRRVKAVFRAARACFVCFSHATPNCLNVLFMIASSYVRHYVCQTWTKANEYLELF